MGRKFDCHQNNSQRLLASATRDMCSMEDVFSYELAAVAPALFLDNGRIDECAAVYHRMYCSKLFT